jgi:hypothetical protein
MDVNRDDYSKSKFDIDDIEIYPVRLSKLRWERVLAGRDISPSSPFSPRELEKIIRRLCRRLEKRHILLMDRPQ